MTATRSSSTWRRRLSALAATFLLFATGAVADDGARAQEDEVKAAFLFNFAKFIEWPTQRFPSAHSPIVIGAFCPAGFGAALARITANRRISGRAIDAQTLEAPETARQSHLVFVCAGHETQLPAILHAVAGAAVVTVGESESFWKQGGMFNFVVRDERVRFDINVAAAEQSGVKVSAQLQKLALAIHRPVE